MKRHYALISVTGISEKKFEEYLSNFIHEMHMENQSKFGATVLGMEENVGKQITYQLENQ